MTSTPIVVGGKRIGRIRASFLLLTETFRFFWSDKEMLLVPIIATVAQLFLIGLVFVTVIVPAGLFLETTETSAQAISPLEYLYLFIFYVIGAFTVASSQAVITHIVYTRVRGGNASLGDGLAMVPKHFFSLLVWACITSTVGLLLRSIAERSQLLVKVLVALLGAAWSVLTYFVVPAIVIDNKSVLGAISHSGGVFKRTWGETLVSNTSLSLAITLSFIGLIVVLGGVLFVTGGSVEALIICGVIFIVAILVATIVGSILSSVLRTLLYVYANEQIIPANFNKELLENILVRKEGDIRTPIQTGVQ